MIKMYTAEWCSSCKNLKKKIDLMKVDIEYIDIDKNAEEARALGIRGIPFLINTETDERLVGNVSVDQFKKFIS